MPTSRTYQKADGRWYYARRGDKADGPFPTRHAAEKALFRHLHSVRVRLQRDPGIGWPRTWTPLRLLRRERPQDAAGQ
ncbi:MAG: hypothetical protein AAGI15_01545 [Pseudomonadota bacterium]